MKKYIALVVVIFFTVVSCKNEDHLKWPKAKGIIVGTGDNGRIGKGHTPHFEVKFKDKDGKEILGKYDADTFFTTTKVGDSVEFYYNPISPTLLYNKDIYNEMQSQN